MKTTVIYLGVFVIVIVIVIIILHYIGHTFTQVPFGKLDPYSVFMMSDSLLFSFFFFFFCPQGVFLVRFDLA